MTNKALFCSFFADFCTFCASFWLKRTVFSQLSKKAVSMALWTKAITCDKAGFKSRFCQVHQAGKNIISVNPVILSNFSSCLCAFCAFLSLKTPFNQRNPWLINDLQLFKALYNCRETFTDVMSALQIKLFMQNKANFRKSQMNVNKVLTKDYEKMDTWWSGKNKANSNPNKAKSKKAKMNVTSIITVDYEDMSNWAICENEPNSNPTCRGVASGEAGTNPISEQNIVNSLMIILLYCIPAYFIRKSRTWKKSK